MPWPWESQQQIDWNALMKQAAGSNIAGNAYNMNEGLSGGAGGMFGSAGLGPYADQGALNNYGYGSLLGPGILGGGTGQNAPAAGGTAPGAYGSGPNWYKSGMAGGGVSGYAGPNTIGNVTYSGVSNQEKLLDKLFGGAVTGHGGGPIASTLFNFGQGMLPPALAQQIAAGTAEQFGKLGARFGTDLGTATARGLAQASESQALNAIQQILGLGGTTAGFQFTRGENALQRAMQEYIAQQQNDPTMSLINALLGGG